MIANGEVKSNASLKGSTGPLPVSVIVLTYNEESNIEACLRSVVPWAGEVFVVDSGSTDRTVEIAKQFTPLVVSHPFEDYSRQRNWAQDRLALRHDWVFHLDADERVTPELAESMRALFKDGEPRGVDGALVSRRTIFLGRAILHGGRYPTYHLRLFRRRAGRCEERLYDQHFLVQGVTRKIKGDVIDVITSDLTTWLIRHARWGAAEAREELNGHATDSSQVQGHPFGSPIEQRRWQRNFLYGRAPLFLRAFAYFLYRYFFLLGFLDGKEGLIFHFLHGCFFRFYIDAKIFESRLQAKTAASAAGRLCSSPIAEPERAQSNELAGSQLP